MHAGLYDDSPRSRELVWILMAQRAARGLGSLYAHANEMTMEEAGGDPHGLDAARLDEDGKGLADFRTAALPAAAWVTAPAISPESTCSNVRWRIMPNCAKNGARRLN